VRRTSIALSRHDRHRGVTRHETGADPRRFAGGEEDLDLRTLSVRALWWRPLFLERRGVEQFDTVEDFDIGPRLGLEAGYTSTLLGSTADEGLFRLSAGVGVETRRFGFGLASARVSTRTRRDLREAVAHFDARWVQQPGRDLSVVTAAHGAVVERGPRETQFVLGGLDGLRAYPVQALNGTQVWRFNTEVRGVARRDVFNLVTVGGAVFHDAARAWGEGSAAGPWHHDAGFGLRLSFPHASLHQVARFDVAFPLSPTRDGRREPVFSFGSSQAF
jgi:hemolysin activation/secretion protein